MLWPFILLSVVFSLPGLPIMLQYNDPRWHKHLCFAKKKCRKRPICYNISAQSKNSTALFAPSDLAKVIRKHTENSCGLGIKLWILNELRGGIKQYLYVLKCLIRDSYTQPQHNPFVQKKWCFTPPLTVVHAFFAWTAVLDFRSVRYNISEGVMLRPRRIEGWFQHPSLI